MFNRIKTLVLMQLNNRRTRRVNNVIRHNIIQALIALAIIAVLSYAINMVIELIQNMSFLRIDQEKILFLYFIYYIMSIFTLAKTFQVTLYKNKDKELLLTYPVKGHEIFISKLIFSYIQELKKSIFFVAPLIIGYYLHNPYYLSNMIFLRVIVLTLLGSMLIVLFAALLSIGLVYFTYITERFTIIKITLMLAVCAAIFGFFVSYLLKIPPNLRLNAIWNEIIKGFDSFVLFINQFTFSSKWLINYVFGMNKWISFLYITLALLVLVGATTLIAMPFYYYLSTHAVEYRSSKKYKSVDKAHKNLFFVFLKKEIKSYMRSDDQVLNTFLYLVILPLLLVALNIIFRCLKISESGEQIIIVINMMLSIILLSSSNMSSATALSREGSEFYLLKIAPIKTNVMAGSKLVINWILSTLCIVITVTALMSVKVVKPINLFYMGILLVLVNSGHILWSFELDLMNPKISDYASGETINENRNATKSIIIGLVLGFLFAFISFFFFNESFPDGWLKVLGIGLAFIAYRVYSIIVKVKYYFNDIAM